MYSRKNTPHGNVIRFIFVLFHIIAAMPLPLAATEYTFATGSSATAMSGLLANNDTVLISGSSGTLSLSDSQNVDVSNWVQMTGGFTLDGKTGLSFRPASGSSTQWALIDRAAQGRVVTIAASTGTTFLQLDRVIIMNGALPSNAANSGGGMLVSGTNNTHFVLNGDVIFYGNSSGFAGGGMAGIGSITFGGEVVFASNKAGFVSRNGGGFGTLSGVTNSLIKFEKNALFISNTAANSGGGLYAHTGHSMIFKGSATFKFNLSGSASGGGIFFAGAAGSAGDLTFEGDTWFESNSSGVFATTHGGGIYAADLVDIVFAAPAGAGTGVNVTFKGNKTVSTGGAIRAGSLAFTGNSLVVQDNFAGTLGADGQSPNSTAATGGGLRIVNDISINGRFDISGNQTFGDGAGIYASAKLEMLGAGCFYNNMAYRNGGAIYATGAIHTIDAAAVFDGNIAAGKGGAMYISARSTLTLTATTGDIVFKNNSEGATLSYANFATTSKMTVTNSGSANAIYFAAASSTLNIQAGAGHAVQFYDPLSVVSGSLLILKKTGAGTLQFDTHHTNIEAAVSVNDGQFTLSNGAVFGSGTNSGTFALAGGAGLSGNGKLLAHTVNVTAGAQLGVSDGGVLRIEAANVNIGGDLSLAGSGTIQASGVTDWDAARIRAGGLSSPGVLSIEGNLSLENTVLDFGIFANGADQLVITGNASVVGSNTINVSSVMSGTYNIGNVIGLDTASTAVTIGGEEQRAGARQRADITSDGANLQIVASADLSRVLYWTGDTSGDWNTSQRNWTDDGAVEEFAGGDRVVFDGSHDSAHADRRALAIGANGVRVSDMFVQGGSDYAFSGTGGITADSGYVNTITGSNNITNAQGKLIKDGAGILRFENDGPNLFHGGIDIKAGAILFDRAAQLGDGGNGITFAGSGTLAAAAGGLNISNNIKIGAGQAGAIDAQNHTLTLSGTIMHGDSASVLKKNGAGTLVLAGDSSAYSGTFQVATGTVMMTSAAKIGGAVDVAGGAVFGGAGQAGGLVRAGAGARIQIGITGDGSETLTLANARLSNGAVLGGAGTLAGAATIGAAQADNVTASVETGKTLAVAAALGGSGTLTKTGAGTLVLSGSNTHNGIKRVAQGALQGNVQSLGGNIYNEAELIFDQGADAEFTGTVSGGGNIIKKGGGNLLIGGQVTGANFNIDAGRVTVGETVSLHAATAFSIGSGGVLTGSGTIKTPLLTNSGTIMGPKASGYSGTHGKLTIDGDYTGGGGTVLLAVSYDGGFPVLTDQLHITGSASGSTQLALAITNTSGLAAGNTTLVHADKGFSNGENTFVLAGRHVLPDGEDLKIGYDENGNVRIETTISPEAEAVTGADVAGFLIGRAAIDTLGNRLHALRMGGATQRNDVWIAGMHRHDKISSSTYDGATSNTQGAQAGLDTCMKDGGRTLRLGVFADYAKSDLHVRDNTTATSTDSTGAGIYATYVSGAFYIDGIMRGSWEKYRISVPGTAAFDMRGDSWAGALALGFVIEGDLGWNLDPEVQVYYQSHRIEDATDAWGRVYHTDRAQSLNGRASVRFWTPCELKKNVTVIPYMRAGYEYEFEGDGVTSVAGKRFANSMSGGGMFVDAGTTMQLGGRFSIDARGAWFYGSTLSGYSVNLGCCYKW